MRHSKNNPRVSRLLAFLRLRRVNPRRGRVNCTPILKIGPGADYVRYYIPEEKTNDH